MANYHDRKRREEAARTQRQPTPAQGSRKIPCPACNGQGGKYVDARDYVRNGKWVMKKKWEKCVRCLGARMILP